MTLRREDLVAAAKRLQADKEKSLDALIDATEKVADINDQLAEAQREFDVAVRAAVKAGWADQELTKIGFDLSGVAPKAPRSGGRRNNKKPISNGNGTTPVGASSAAAPASPAAGSTT